MTVPHITIEQAKIILRNGVNMDEVLSTYNAYIDDHNGQQCVISWVEAKALGFGYAEYKTKHEAGWKVCESDCYYNPDFQYRAIKQEPEYDEAAFLKRVEENVATFVSHDFGKTTEPAEPTCQIKNLDTGELKTMTQEAAKKLQAETKDVCDWFCNNGSNCNDLALTFNAPGIYTYKLKANLVKLNGELMTREAAIAMWEAVKDKCDVWIKNDVTIVWELTNLSRKFIVYAHEVNCEYQLRPKPLKQVSWNDVPVGVAVTVTLEGQTWILDSVDGSTAYLRKAHAYATADISEIELAAASEQINWIARQDNYNGEVAGLIYEWRDNGSYRITGLAEGWVLK